MRVNISLLLIELFKFYSYNIVFLLFINFLKHFFMWRPTWAMC